MGLIRGGLITLSSIILFLLFFAGNLFLTISWSLEYDLVKPEITSIVQNIGEEQMNVSKLIEDQISFMEIYCENNSEFVFSGQESTFVIPCDIVSNGSEAVLNYGTESFIEEIYYQEYNCSFWSCVRQVDSGNPFVLISAKAKNYWTNLFYITLLISLAVLVVLFFLLENKHELLIISGVSLAVASLPFMKINWFLSLFSESYVAEIFSIFFSQSYSVFLFSFITGLFVFIAGIAFKFWGLSNFISQKFLKKGDAENKESKK